MMKLTAAQVYDKAIAEAKEARVEATRAAWEVYEKARDKAAQVYDKSCIDNPE